MNTQLAAFSEGNFNRLERLHISKVGFLIAVNGCKHAIDFFPSFGVHDQWKFSTSMRFSTRWSSWEYSSQRPFAETSR